MGKMVSFKEVRKDCKMSLDTITFSYSMIYNGIRYNIDDEIDMYSGKSSIRIWYWDFNTLNHVAPEDGAFYMSMIGIIWRYKRVILRSLLGTAKMYVKKMLSNLEEIQEEYFG